MSGEGRIDVHAHYIAPVYREALERAGMAMIGGIPVPPWSPELALGFMDAHGIERQLLSVSDPGVGFLPAPEAIALARRCNDYLAALIHERPDRFGGFAVVPMQAPDAAVLEIGQALDELGLAGVGLLSSSAGAYLGDEDFEPVLAELDRRGAWVFVHPTAVADQEKPTTPIPDFVTEYPFDTTRTIVSLLINNSFERFPRIRWHFAHGGGTIPMLAARLNVAATHAKLMAPVLGLPEHAAELEPDSAERALRNSCYDTALIAARASLVAVSAIAGSSQILFGSDWPFAALMYPPEGDPQPALADVFSAEARAAIERGSALGLLGS
ncbi:MAG: amidohydrolase [Actinobacteria bacterium]|nr:amidohydrolase [Actinomycetota bacterium]